MGDPMAGARAAYYSKMARATYDLAEECDDLELLSAYLDIAAAWVRRSYIVQGLVAQDEALEPLKTSDETGGSE